MIRSLAAAAALILSAIASPALDYVPVRDSPPAIAREFRAAWIATVFNINWPSRPGLPAATQKAELARMLDRAAAMNLNAVILQVRPGCDALYESKLDPWSNWLTGTMGQSPGYDPLAFAVAEAHARGLELHAWFNPFRALSSPNITASSGHVTRRHPDWVRKYNGKVWLDPGLKDAREFALRVMLDVVKRYDVDGIHIDDYFYPYPEGKSAGEFPDAASYKASGSRLARDDWRRANIDGFVEELYRSIKSSKPWVKFGISPFGIWRPGVPSGTTASLDAYGMLYADSRRWLREGWCDYFSPQLYWPIAGEQGYAKLLSWWDSENVKHRHVWPGIAADRIGASRPASEHGRQIELARGGTSAGHVHWNLKPLLADTRGVAGMLAKSHYAQKALVPPSPWLSRSSQAEPKLSVRAEGGALYVDWKTSGPTPRNYAVQVKINGRWQAPNISAGFRKGVRLPGSPAPEAIAVTAVNIYGTASRPTVVGRR